MAKRSKAYKAAVAKIEEGKLYTPPRAVAWRRKPLPPRPTQPLRLQCVCPLTP